MMFLPQENLPGHFNDVPTTAEITWVIVTNVPTAGEFTWAIFKMFHYPLEIFEGLFE